MIMSSYRAVLCLFLFFSGLIAKAQTYEVYDQHMKLKSRVEFDRISVLGEAVRISTADEEIQLLSKEYKPFLGLKANSVYCYDQPWIVVEGPHGKGVFHEYGEEILAAEYDEVQTLFTKVLYKKGRRYWMYEHSNRKKTLLGDFDDAQLARNGQVIARIGQEFFLPLSPEPERAKEMVQEANGDFLFVKESTGYGLINREGVYVLDPIIDHMEQLEDIYFFAFDGNQYMLVKAHEIRAAINYTSYHKITLEGDMMLEYIHGKLRRVMKNDGILLDQAGMERVVPLGRKYYKVQMRDQSVGLLGPKGWEVRPVFGVGGIFPGKDGVYPAEQNGKFGFVDSRGAWLVKPGFEEVGTFSQGLAPVRLNGYWGFVDQAGEMVISPQFDHVSDFRRNISIAKRAGKQYLINKHGLELLPTGYDRVSLAADDYFITEDAGLFGLVSPEGKEIVEPKFQELRREDLDRILVRMGDRYGIMNEQGEYVLPVYYKSIVFDPGASQILAEDDYQFSMPILPEVEKPSGKKKRGG